MTDLYASRLNELTAVMNRGKFEEPPGTVESEEDLARWADFRASYHRATTLDEWAEFPLQLDFELSSRCNFRCAFCVHGHTKVAPAKLGWDRFKRAIDEGSEHGLASIKLNYINEPLLVKDLAAHIRYARSRGVLNTYFATNGLLLSGALSEELIDAGLSKIFISLDAVTPETFLKMRQSTKLDKITANIHTLLETRERLGVRHPIVRVNFLKTSVNMHEAEAFVAKWSPLVDMIGFQDRVRLPGIEENDDDEAVDLHRDLDGFRCSFPFKQVVVDATGKLLPCCTFSGREMPIGHIDESTIKQAWDSHRMESLKRLHARGDWRSNPVCDLCVKGCAS